MAGYFVILNILCIHLNAILYIQVILTLLNAFRLEQAPTELPVQSLGLSKIRCFRALSAARDTNPVPCFDM